MKKEKKGVRGKKQKTNLQERERERKKDKVIPEKKINYSSLNIGRQGKAVSTSSLLQVAGRER